MKREALALASVLAAVAACRGEAQKADATAPPVQAASASAGASLCAAHQALDTMDQRQAVPLLPMMANHQKQMMRDHLVSVQGIADGLARNDFAAIETAAKKSGCSHMGTGAPGFTEQAITFHKSADAIADAARSKDRDAVVRGLAATLATCVGCHAKWKQQIVDDGTWARVSAGSPARE
jgi:hypothetical protein